jgi:hypothetical protein
MKRLFTAFIAIIALTLALALPASAGAKFDEVQWVCDSTVLVSAPGAAKDGITRANQKAGAVFFDQFGEECSVVLRSP